MLDIITALILGFKYGFGPCTISCAPLVVPLIMYASKNKKEGVIYSIIFGVGRVISYVFLGFLVGLLGQELGFFLPRRVLGIFFILLGIAVLFKIQGRCILKSKFKITGPFMSLFAGIVYGLGPCPPLLALLALAATSKSALTGALMGLLFGIGTVISPIIILGFFSGWFAKQKEFKKVIPYVSGGFLILLGIIYILLG
ncbi:sulfite exporter TauE/SafE family protein [Candidatus Woesearchaeota archaeon]|nr:sulfite exporter TauE/SafE family protein [Candidatus Woesearchaeota archaeon]